MPIYLAASSDVQLHRLHISWVPHFKHYPSIVLKHKLNNQNVRRHRWIANLTNCTRLVLPDGLKHCAL